MAYVAASNVSTGDVLTASRYNQDVVENVAVIYASQRRLAIVTRGPNATVASTANLTAPNELFSTDLSFTAAGSTEYLVEVYVPYVTTATNNGASIDVWLTNGSTTGIATLGAQSYGNGTYAAAGSLFARYRYSPSAGTINLNVAAVHSGAAGSIGSANANFPAAYMAVYGPDIT